MQEKNSGALSTKTLSWIIKRNKKKYYDYKKTKLITKNIFSSFQRKNSSFYAKSLCDCSWRRAIQKQKKRKKSEIIIRNDFCYFDLFLLMLTLFSHYLQSSCFDGVLIFFSIKNHFFFFLSDGPKYQLVNLIFSSKICPFFSSKNHFFIIWKIWLSWHTH